MVAAVQKMAREIIQGLAAADFIEHQDVGIHGVKCFGEPAHFSQWLIAARRSSEGLPFLFVERIDRLTAPLLHEHKQILTIQQPKAQLALSRLVHARYHSRNSPPLWRKL